MERGLDTSVIGAVDNKQSSLILHERYTADECGNSQVTNGVQVRFLSNAVT